MAVQAMAGRAKPSRGSGVQPLPWSNHRLRADAGISGSRAAALAVGDPTEWAKAGFFAERKKCHTELEEI